MLKLSYDISESFANFYFHAAADSAIIDGSYDEEVKRR